MPPSIDTMIIYQSDRTRITRQELANDAFVIVKETLGPDAIVRARHEQSILARLTGQTGVAQLAPALREQTPTEFALHDIAGTTLATFLAGEPVIRDVISIGLELANVVGAVHGRGVVHRDISPANIMVGPRRTLTLIDFGLASTCAEDRPGYMHQSEISGTVSYMSPEQTGRTGRAIDQRADLYALGVVLYQCATGRLPFQDEDLLRLIHAHLTQVPEPPHVLEPTMPLALSAIITRLMEKEPDRRYQSAEGLAHDLLRLQKSVELNDNTLFPLGERDFPRRLAPPSRPLGREVEVAALHAALEGTIRGECHDILISGAPGVGKTALINELRPLVTARGGFLVSGKFDQYRHEAPTAIVQAIRALGQQLLAESEREIDALRSRIMDAVGTDAMLLASFPELETFLHLGDQRDASKPADIRDRLTLAVVALLRAVVTPLRPLVFIIDDLQWASPSSIDFIDALMMKGQPIPGLLLVLAWRDAEVDATHPLSATLPRWEKLTTAPLRLALTNLPATGVAELAGEMLRLPAQDAAELGAALVERSAGNPFDTVELINALRNDGVLNPSDAGWTWDAAMLRRHIGTGDVIALLAVRIARLPHPCIELLQIVACLGGEVSIPFLTCAAGKAAEVIESALTPALEDGLIVREQSGAIIMLRLKHDRVQQALYGLLEKAPRRILHRTIARRMAASDVWRSRAAEHYLPVFDALTDPAEKRLVVHYFQAAATDARKIANPSGSERFLRAALEVLATLEADTEDDALQRTLLAQRHVVLYILGRLEEADCIYAALQTLTIDPWQLVDAACTQITSFANRSRYREAIDLGTALLPRIGIAIPCDEDIGDEITLRLDELYGWVGRTTVADDLQRPQITDEHVIKSIRLVSELIVSCYACGERALARWFILKSTQYWAEYGPTAFGIGMSTVALVTIPLRADFRIGYTITRHTLEIAAARAYEPMTSFTRNQFHSASSHWFEPLERAVAESRLSREGLLRSGDVQFACFTHIVGLTALLDCAPTLDDVEEELTAAEGFAQSSLNRHASGTFRAYRRLLDLLRGRSDGESDDTALALGLADLPMSGANFHTYRALGAALFDDGAALSYHAASAMRMLSYMGGRYQMALAHVLQAIALARQISVASACEQTALFSEFDACREWLALRAADAPFNFGHLLSLLDAERAAAMGDFQSAMLGYDVALLEVEHRGRRWHAALIAERAARFAAKAGLVVGSRHLFRGARELFAAWGATAKVRQLDEEFRFLRTESRPVHTDLTTSSVVSAQSIDLLAILRASQALSSQTDLRLLEASVIDLLAELTGATSVTVILHHDDAWCLVSSDTTADEAMLTVDAAAALGRLPISAFHYVARTQQPLLVNDVTNDDRFMRDPYFAGVTQCSLLGVPVQNQGALQAVLLLENRLASGAFTTGPLDAVNLIAGQFAVSLNNVMVYSSLEQKVAGRTEALADANQRLELLSMTDPLTGLPNRRRMNEVLQGHWARAVTTGTSIGIAMVDIDQFKLYNDHYGHLGGDAALRLIAGTLNRGRREDVDLVARYGGEEFVIVLPDTDLKGTSTVAERVRRMVADLREPHAQAERGFLTVSIGIAALVPTTELCVEQHLQLADEALYEAKRNGRNQVAAAHAPIAK